MTCCACAASGVLGAGHAQPHRERDQPLLSAVVQIPLQPPPLGVGGVDHPGPGLG
jgi:hypothetical protein